MQDKEDMLFHYFKKREIFRLNGHYYLFLKALSFSSDDFGEVSYNLAINLETGEFTIIQDVVSYNPYGTTSFIKVTTSFIRAKSHNLLELDLGKYADW